VISRSEVGGSDDLSRHRKRIVVVRHAKSSWDDPALADHDRHLAPRGRRAVQRLRHHFERLGLRPDLVLCSSSRRTRETLEGIRPALGRHADVQIDRGLYAAEAEQLLHRLQRLDDQVTCVVLIGHNPGVADLTDLLVGHGDPVERKQAIDKFPTGAVALLSVAGEWRGLQRASATLDGYWQPRPST
jgi:phosphohistidine phosphatase